MTFEQYFLVVWGLVSVYVVIENYLYFAKVLPGLGGASPKLPLFGQFSQIEDYLNGLDQKGERPWFYAFLRHTRMITLVLAVLIISAFIKVLM